MTSIARSTLTGFTPAPNPIPPSGPGASWRSSRFPVIYENRSLPANRGYRTRWDQAVAQNLTGITDRRLLARFKRTQPFYRRKHARFHWSGVLDELWNTDKHHSIVLIRSLMSLHQLGLAGALRFPPGPLMNLPDYPLIPLLNFSKQFSLHLVKRRHLWPIEHDTEEIARFRLKQVGPVPEQCFDPQLNVDVDVRNLFYIAFG